MSLDVLELVVHENLDVRRRRNIFVKEGWVFLEGLNLDFADDAASFRYVILQFAARLG